MNPLFSHSQIALVDWKYIGFSMNLFKQKRHYIGWQAAYKPSAINFNRSQKLKREVFGYS